MIPSVLCTFKSSIKLEQMYSSRFACLWFWTQMAVACVSGREAGERFVFNFGILLISAFGATELYETVNLGIWLLSTLFSSLFVIRHTHSLFLCAA